MSGSAVDALAAWDPRARALSLGLIHHSPSAEAIVVPQVSGLKRFGSVSAWRIGGPSLGATNIPGKPETVTTTPLHEPFALNQPVRLPRHSITVVRWEKVDCSVRASKLPGR